MNPQPLWDELQPYYDNNYDPYDPMHGSEANDDSEVKRAELLGSFRHISIQKRTRILDVGSGAGYFLRIAKKLGAVEQGVEPSQYAANLAQKQGLNVFHGTLEDFARQDGTKNKFDIITANHVIEHVPDPVETLQTMKQFLAPGGFIWIAVPNAANQINKAIKGYWHSADLPYHVMQFSPASMLLAGERAGLKMRYQKTESIPKIVESSIGLYLRYKWKLPRRITQKLGILTPISRWYADRIDRQVNGEAIITEFIHQ
jgi:2-polyprenyl-3-methyl-5-hydroxy-6-metoxy-1,4-benzoquinol methylase